MNNNKRINTSKKKQWIQNDNTKRNAFLIWDNNVCMNRWKRRTPHNNVIIMSYEHNNVI